MKTIRVGTRGSRLALAQTQSYIRELQRACPGLEARLEIIRTRGDANQQQPLSEIGGKGLFTREIEEALLGGRIDLAVHSMKDMPAGLPEGLVFAAPPRRAPERDVLVVREEEPARTAAEFLTPGRVIGTGSLRRACQIAERFPGVEIRDIRGNIDTRIRKMLEGGYDGIVLAQAGLTRLRPGQQNVPMRLLALPDDFVPAPAQGILAIEVREDDEEILALCRAVSDPAASLQARAERAFLEALDGNCRLPIGAHAQAADGKLILTGLYGDESGWFSRQTLEGPADKAEEIGRALAEALVQSHEAMRTGVRQAESEVKGCRPEK